MATEKIHGFVDGAPRLPCGLANGVTTTFAEQITCRPCTKAIAAGVFSGHVSHYENILTLILAEKQTAAVATDFYVQSAKRSLDASIAEARHTFERALEELNREATRDVLTVGRFSSEPVDVALAVGQRPVQYAANNVRLDMLVKYAVQLQAEKARVCAEVEAADAAETRRVHGWPRTPEGV